MSIAADPWGILVEIQALRAEQAEQRRLLEQLLARTAPKRLQSLAACLGCTTGAAWARLSRDAGLRALGTPLGNGRRVRLVFDRDQVLAYLRQRREAA